VFFWYQNSLPNFPQTFSDQSKSKVKHLFRKSPFWAVQTLIQKSSLPAPVTNLFTSGTPVAEHPSEECQSPRRRHHGKACWQKVVKLQQVIFEVWKKKHAGFSPKKHLNLEKGEQKGNRNQTMLFIVLRGRILENVGILRPSCETDPRYGTGQSSQPWGVFVCSHHLKEAHRKKKGTKKLNSQKYEQANHIDIHEQAIRHNSSNVHIIMYLWMPNP